MEILDKSDAKQIWAVLRGPEHVDSLKVLWIKSFLAFR